jgi:hypothetical protein
MALLTLSKYSEILFSFVKNPLTYFSYKIPKIPTLLTLSKESLYLRSLPFTLPKESQHFCSTTGKPTRSFATERVSLDSV